MQESGHLAASHCVLRAEAVVDRRVAALCDARCGKSLDDLLERADVEHLAADVGVEADELHRAARPRPLDRPLGRAALQPEVC